jgi:hypothetical protein
MQKQGSELYARITKARKTLFTNKKARRISDVPNFIDYAVH